MQLKPGTLLQSGKYRIVRFINSGGFGCTYEALHTMFDEKVAIKEFFVKDFCNRDESTSHVTVGTQGKKALVEKLKRKFIEEAKVLYKMKHQGIVTVKDIFEENGTAYYVMDYIEGKSLRDIVTTQGALNENRTLKYTREVAEALSYVHSQNRLHLDIKPGNIMIDENDKAILIDFGTSKQYDEESGENTSTLLGKTPGYAPLEQMGNELVQFYPATDIYALGATMYNMLTCVTPLSATLLASGEELDELPDSISVKTKQAIESSMQLNRKKRPQSIAAFLEILGDTQTSNNHNYSHSSTFSHSSNSTANEETVIDSSIRKNEANGHKYVDLGLSVKWATCNIGADTPEDGGDYFAWGEVKPKEICTEDNYAFCHEKTETQLWNFGYGSKKIKAYDDLGDNISGTRYDAARTNWGGSWRMPTKEELEELVDKCKWERAVQGGKKGYKVTGPNGNSIFLIIVGSRDGLLNIDFGMYGCYWSSTVCKDLDINAYAIYSNSIYDDACVDVGSRYIGRNIRPVIG